MQIRARLSFLIATAALLSSCDLDEIGSFGNSQAYQKDFHYSYALKPGGRLAVDNSNGSVEITGWDQDKVEIDGTQYGSTPELRDAIHNHSRDPNVAPIMLKDVHLIEAALATDRRIVSHDETARGHFRRLAASVASIRDVIWVDPTVPAEHALEWAEQGAPAQRSRRLRPKAT